MKKKISLLVLVLSAVLLFSCGKNAATESNGSDKVVVDKANKSVTIECTVSDLGQAQALVRSKQRWIHGRKYGAYHSGDHR